MSPLTTSEGMWLAGHHLSQVSGVRPRQADRSGAAELLSIEPFIIVIIARVVTILWNRSLQVNEINRSCDLNHPDLLFLKEVKF